MKKGNQDWSQWNAAVVAASELCAFAAQAYDKGAGLAHSPEARSVGKAQAEWCRDEILQLLKK